MPGIDIKPRKAPRQARPQATVELILAAAARVLSRESLAGFNTNRVAEVAGVSVGSLYQYFPNKAALVVALIDRDHDALADALEALLESPVRASLRDTLHAVARLLIEQQFGDPVYAAAIDHEERRLPTGSRARQAELRFAAVATALLARARRDLAHAAGQRTTRPAGDGARHRRRRLASRAAASARTGTAHRACVARLPGAGVGRPGSRVRVGWPAAIVGARCRSAETHSQAPSRASPH